MTPIIYPYDGDDAAADWYPLDVLLDGFAPSYDEWSALRLAAGRPAGTFDDYLSEIGPRRGRDDGEKENHE